MVNLPILALVGTIHRRHRQVSLVSQSLNRHGLVCFVIANLLTGAVNLSINTLEVEDGTAIVILLAYITSIGKLATILEALTDSTRMTKTTTTSRSNEVSKED